ncbi:uncharacterized protein M6B38_166670 [Iris pallida]|uniref:Uncharacterized protein n=1 Tax=Iris pallida TaxID=29817 RepID=A0AAX6EWS3_IRIPA|nr:uncharacterized protein M6B38_166670 [Iris pallida]
MGRATPASSSSGEEDGDADWKAAIDSIASIDVSNKASNGRTKRNPDSADSGERDTDDEKKKKASAPALKLYQIKAQKLLDDLVGKNLELVQSSIPPTDNNHKSDEGGIRLFRKAPLGILVDPIGTSIFTTTEETENHTRRRN